MSRYTIVANNMELLCRNMPRPEIICCITQYGTYTAQANHTQIKIYPLFFAHGVSNKNMLFVFAHELGHVYYYNLEYVDKKRIMYNSENEIPHFGQGFFTNAQGTEEGFADLFAMFLTNPKELKLKYPEQYSVLVSLIGMNDRDRLLRYLKSIDFKQLKEKLMLY